MHDRDVMCDASLCGAAVIRLREMYLIKSILEILKRKYEVRRKW